MRGIDQRKAREISSFFFQINIRKKYIYQLSVLRSSSRMWWDANYVRIIISEYWKLNISNWLFMSWNHSPKLAIERQREKEINFVIDRFHSVQIEIPSFIIVAINQKEFGEFSLTDTRSLSLSTNRGECTRKDEWKREKKSWECAIFKLQNYCGSRTTRKVPTNEWKTSMGWEWSWEQEAKRNQKILGKILFFSFSWSWREKIQQRSYYAINVTLTILQNFILYIEPRTPHETWDFKSVVFCSLLFLCHRWKAC